MEDVIELKEVKRADVIINNDIDNSKIMFPEKLKAAKEMLEKYPLPADLLLKRYSEIQQKEGIFVTGTIKRADAATNTFLVVKMSGPYEIEFKICTKPETLKQLVKTYWGEAINVLIRPQINEDNQFEYELMEVR